MSKHTAKLLAQLIAAFVTLVTLGVQMCDEGCSWSFTPHSKENTSHVTSFD